MTVRVTVKTHGCPCHVSVDGADPVRVDHHQQQTFDVSGESSISFREEEPSAEHGNERPFEGEEVPGRAQNDALLGKVETNNSTTETKAPQDGRTGEHPAPQTGRGQRPLKGEPPADVDG